MFWMARKRLGSGKEPLNPSADGANTISLSTKLLKVSHINLCHDSTSIWRHWTMIISRGNYHGYYHSSADKFLWYLMLCLKKLYNKLHLLTNDKL